jgi:hypothetical protein
MDGSIFRLFRNAEDDLSWPIEMPLNDRMTVVIVSLKDMHAISSRIQA